MHTLFSFYHIQSIQTRLSMSEMTDILGVQNVEDNRFN